MNSFLLPFYLLGSCGSGSALSTGILWIWFDELKQLAALARTDSHPAYAKNSAACATRNYFTPAVCESQRFFPEFQPFLCEKGSSRFLTQSVTEQNRFCLPAPNPAGTDFSHLLRRVQICLQVRLQYPLLLPALLQTSLKTALCGSL